MHFLVEKKVYAEQIHFYTYVMGKYNINTDFVAGTRSYKIQNNII